MEKAPGMFTSWPIHLICIVPVKHAPCIPYAAGCCGTHSDVGSTLLTRALDGAPWRRESDLGMVKVVAMAMKSLLLVMLAFPKALVTLPRLLW